MTTDRPQAFVPKTDEQIVARVSERAPFDWMGIEQSDLIVRLPLELATPFMNSKPDTWEQLPRDRESLLKEMLDYMPFAWDKANCGRGLSAGRSMSHYSAWTWLAGDDLGNLTTYEFYGKDNLVRICQFYGWDHAQWDDGVRTNTSN